MARRKKQEDQTDDDSEEDEIGTTQKRSSQKTKTATYSRDTPPRYVYKPIKPKKEKKEVTLPLEGPFTGFDDNAFIEHELEQKRRKAELKKFPFGKPQSTSTPRRSAKGSKNPRPISLSPVVGTSNRRRLFNEEEDKDDDDDEQPKPDDPSKKLQLWNKKQFYDVFFPGEPLDDEGEKEEVDASDSLNSPETKKSRCDEPETDKRVNPDGTPFNVLDFVLRDGSWSNASKSEIKAMSAKTGKSANRPLGWSDNWKFNDEDFVNPLYKNHEDDEENSDFDDRKIKKTGFFKNRRHSVNCNPDGTPLRMRDFDFGESDSNQPSTSGPQPRRVPVFKLTPSSSKVRNRSSARKTSAKRNKQTVDYGSESDDADETDKKMHSGKKQNYRNRRQPVDGNTDGTPVSGRNFNSVGSDKNQPSTSGPQPPRPRRVPAYEPSPITPKTGISKSNPISAVETTKKAIKEDDKRESDADQTGNSVGNKKTPRRSCQPKNFEEFFEKDSQDGSDTNEEEPSEAQVGTGRRSARRDPLERERLRKEREEEKEKRKAALARKRESEARRKEMIELDRKTKKDIKKIARLVKKREAEEDKASRRQLIDSEKEKKLNELKERDRMRKQIEHDKRRRRDSSLRRRELRSRGLCQTQARSANRSYSTPLAIRHSKRIQARVPAPPTLPKPQGRSKSEPRNLGRGRLLEPKLPVKLAPPCSRYLENLNEALLKMKDNLFAVAAFESKASRAIPESVPRNWVKFYDPFSVLRTERFNYLRSKYIGGVYDPDQSLELSASDTLEIVGERWRNQIGLNTWSDRAAQQAEPFEEVVHLAEKFGFISLRDLCIPTCIDFFQLPQIMRDDGLIMILQKFRMLIAIWLVENKRNAPRVIHYFKMVIGRIRSIEDLYTVDSDQGREEYKKIRDVIFWLPVHLGDVLDDVHLPRQHLIPLARQLFRVVLNDWPLLFRPCPEAELHALYRLELAALRLEARLGPIDTWLPFWKPRDESEFWKTVDEEEPHTRRHLGNVKISLYERPVRLRRFSI